MSFRAFQGKQLLTPNQTGDETLQKCHVLAVVQLKMAINLHANVIAFLKLVI